MDLHHGVLLGWKLVRFKQMGYAPLPAQWPIHAAPERTILLAGGEGAGKSYVSAMEVCARDVTWRLVYIVAPKYESAFPEFDYIADGLTKLAMTNRTLISRPVRGQAHLTTYAGQHVTTLSSQDGPRAITGTGQSPDVVLMVEAGKQTFDVFLACVGRVARTRGLLLLSGTFESSSDWYAEYFTRWQAKNPEDARSFALPTWSNTATYPGGIDNPEIERLRRTYPPDRFSERFAACPVRSSELVIKEFEYGRHVDAEARYDPALPVELWIDPGYSGSHYAVEVVQFPNDRDVLVVDEIYADHATTQEVIAVAREKPWWRSTIGGVVDVAAQAHAAMPSVWEVWNEAGIRLRTNRVEVAEGVELHRTFLKPPDGSAPRLKFNPGILGAFKEYGTWKRQNVGGTLGAPMKTSCDAMKAIQYGLFDRFGALGSRKEWKETRLRNLFAGLP